MTSERPTPTITPSLVLGAIVMLAGLLLTLDNFGVVEARRFIRYWPAFLIVLGATQLLQHRPGTSRAQGFMLLLIGTALLSVNLDLLRPRQALSLFLLGLGAILIWRATRKPGAPDASDPSRAFDIVAIMGGGQRVIGSRDFQGGNATAIMGGCEVDLRGASISGEAAVINTFAIMGGVDIKVPSDWSVDMQGVALLGGYNDSTRRPQDDRKRLIVTGFVLMGGVEVQN